MLLELEKKAFLAGYHKAFVFGAGHCPVCKKCPENGQCLHPDLARPSMESSGIDVYATAKNAGIRLKPVSDKWGYVKYIGLMLLE
jgi:predicted metal-binding protein